jgi:eukaryotic-like serine/threonine-protein kinase
MGIVYRANDYERDGSVVALKILDRDAFWRQAVDLFVREIRVIMTLPKHPHIVPVFDAGKTAEGPYYVMQLVLGESLRERLKRERVLPVSTALTIAAEVASALQHAHKHHFLHRDLKPADILLQDGHVFVSDFGIARMIDVDDGEESWLRPVEFAAYMAPEQAIGSPASERSDIYSLGCILFEMIAGSPPFRSPDYMIQKHVTYRTDDLRMFRNDLPSHVERIVSRAMEIDPARRFPTAKEMRKALLLAIERVSQPAPTWRQPIAFLRALLHRER